jgi:hypothetical protein
MFWKVDELVRRRIDPDDGPGDEKGKSILLRYYTVFNPLTVFKQMTVRSGFAGNYQLARLLQPGQNVYSSSCPMAARILVVHAFSVFVVEQYKTVITGKVTF